MAHKQSSYSGNRNASMTQVAGKYEINKSLFCDTTVGKLLFNQKDSITINIDTPVDKALELMVKFGISSLPVKDKDEKFQGILNMSDIVAHMSGCVSDEQSHHQMESKSKDVLKAPCSKLLNLSWESRHAAVLDANERIIVALAKIAAGGLRALVTGKGSWQVISEWQFAVWLATHCHEMDDPNLGDRREWLGSIVDCPIGELGLGESKDMETLSCELTAMEAFKKMVQLGVSSMPIVDANGMLCGTLSFSDLRGLDVSKLKLSINVMEFSSDLYQYPQVVADKETKFGDLLCRIQEREVDRVWLVGRDNKPFGVVSLTDIFQKLNLWLHLSPRLSSRTSSQQVGSKAGGPASPPSAPARHAFSPTKMTEKEKLKETTPSSVQPSAPAAAPDPYEQALQQKLQQQQGGQQQQQQQQGFVRGQ